MFQIDRHKKIYNYLIAHQKATVNELSEMCKVTPMTIRRDLDKMEKDNLVTRVFGGVVLETNLVPDIPYEEKEKLYIYQKRQIGISAAELVVDGSIVILDSGTTCLEIAKNIVDRKNLKVITNDILIAAYLMKFNDIEVYCTGGRVQPQVGGCIDTNTIRFLNEINADICFLGASAVHTDCGIFTFTVEKCEVKKTMLNSSDYKVLVVDDSKFNKKSFAKVCDIEEFNEVIVNNNIGEDIKNELINKDVILKIV